MCAGWILRFCALVGRELNSLISKKLKHFKSVNSAKVNVLNAVVCLVQLNNEGLQA